MNMIFSERPEQPNKSWEKILDPNMDGYKEWLQKLWLKFSPYASPSFKHDIENDEGKFDALTWEMLLANVLLDNGFRLGKSQSTDEPDLCILDGDKRIWIECCLPDKGKPDKPDSIAPKKYDGINNIDRNKSSLRCTGTLKAKKEQHRKWIQKGICQQNEPFIIAIHGKKLDFKISNNDVPDILRPLYGMGDPYMTVFPNGEKESEYGYHEKPEVIKNSGAPVQTCFFCNTENSHISGVIFSKSWFGYSDYPKSPKFCFVENVNAVNRCPVSFESFAQEYDYGENSISIKDG